MELEDNIHNDLPARGVAYKKIMLMAGFALCPAFAILLVVVANASSGPANEFFVGLLHLMARGSALLGAATLLVTFFLVLVTGWNETVAEESREELIGRPSGLPQNKEANHLSNLSSARLELSGLWSPFLVYVLCFAAAELVFYFKPILWRVEWREAADIAHVGNFIAVFLFSYFWFAGVARLHRVGHEITRGKYGSLILGHLVFWGVFIFIHG